MEGQVPPPSSPQAHSTSTSAPVAAPAPTPVAAGDSSPSTTAAGAPPPSPPPPPPPIIKTESAAAAPDHHHLNQQQQQQQQMVPPMTMLIHPQGNNNAAAAPAVPAIITSSAASHGGTTTLLGLGGPIKRKRGRPRKYVEGHGHSSPPVLIVGSSPSTPTPVVSGLSAISGLPTSSSSALAAHHPGVALALAPLAASSPHSHLPFAAAVLQSASPAGASAASPGGQPEKKRGRPPGSGKKQQLAALGAWLAGSAGQGFTPHVLTVAAGEDVATKIISFSQIGPRATCVLSANGAISNVTLRQPATSGGTVTYEGRFEILSLSGSFLLTENGNTRSRTGGLSVSLAGPDGRVIGGSVAGLLVAASPVQVVVGSFIAETRKPVQVQVRPNSGSSSEMIAGTGAANSPLTSPMSISRPVGSSPLNDSINNTNSSSQVTWSGNQEEQQHQQNQNVGHGTDINILPTA